MKNEPKQPAFRHACIRQLMDEEGLSASEFARSMGVTRQAIGAYLSGVTTPQFAIVMRMAVLFQRPMSFFVEGRLPVDEKIAL